MKKHFYLCVYDVLSFLSGRYGNRYIKRLKVMTGSTLLLLSNQLQAQRYDDDITVQRLDTIAKDTIKAPVDENIFCYVMETMPEYPGGSVALMKFIKEHAVYPEELQDMCFHGRVIVQFVVDKKGYIIDPVVVRSLHPKLDSLAITIIEKMPPWKPGMMRGEPIRVKYTVPVIFRYPMEEQTTPKD